MDEADLDYEEVASFQENLKILTIKLSQHNVTDVATQATVRSILSLLKKECPRQSCFESWKDEITVDVLSDALHQLLCLITNKDSLIETALLSGTCLAFLLSYALGPSRGASFVVSLLCNMSMDCFTYSTYVLENEQEKDSNLQPSTENMDKCENFGENQNLLNTRIENNSKNAFLTISQIVDNFRFLLCHWDEASVTENERTLKNIHPHFVHLVIIHGLISCRKTELLIQQVNIKQTVLFIELFLPIYQLCVCTLSFQFQAFQLLLLWLRLADELLHIFYSVDICKQIERHFPLFSYDSDTVHNILQLVEANWENPVHGVPETVKHIYTMLLEVHENEMKILKSPPTLAENLLQKSLDLSWKIKGKYIALSCLIPYIEYEKILENNPDIPSQLIQNLGASYMVSAITQVYTSLVQNMLMKNGNGTEIWVRWWLQPLSNALLFSSRIVQHKTVTHLLPWTLKYVPQSFTKLLEKIREHDEDQCHLAEVTLFRAARQAGICPLWYTGISAIEDKLQHKDEDVRMELLTLICSSPKKAETPNEMEIMLIKDFVQMNLNIDSAPFRNHLIIQMRNFLVRVRDSSLKSLMLAVRNKEALPYSYRINTDFVEWLVRTLLDNIFPGACYQRRCSSLHLLNVVFESFYSPQHRKRKGAIPPKTHLLIERNQNQGKWDFFSTINKVQIFCCLMDCMDEIRILATEILENYFLWVKRDKVFSPEILIKYATTLCNNPHPQYWNAGALIFQLIYKKYVFEKGMHIEFENYRIYSIHPLLSYLRGLTHKISLQLNLAKQNLLTAASNAPVHGFVQALHHCLTDCSEPLLLLCDHEPVEMARFFQDVINVCGDIVDYMLTFLASKADVDSSLAPSFEEMGQAVEDIISVSTGEREENYSLSLEFQLIISYCWLSLKESCLLLGDLVASVLSNRPYTTTLDSGKLAKIGTMITSILLKCRHRGAIEACSLSLEKICKQLLHSSRMPFQKIAETILEEVFSSLSSSSSVTRRSAGFPLLIQSVVAGEPASKKHQLLENVLYRLLDIAAQPLPSDQNDKVDLPQTHAFHILRVLVVNANLSTTILTWLDKIVPVCITGLSSSSWVVRNGALQLFGAVVPRLIGQRKVKEEDSLHNTITPMELFVHYPSLHAYFIQHLTDMVTKHATGNLCTSLVPLLSLLAHLSPAGLSETGSWSLLEAFLPLLYCLLESPMYLIRVLSTSILASFTPPERVNDTIIQLISNLPQPCTKVIHYNKVHGLLLAIERNLHVRDEQFLRSNQGALANVWNAFLKYSWLSTTLNPCPVVRSAYIKIATTLFLKIEKPEEKKHLLKILLPDTDGIQLWRPGHVLWRKQQLLLYIAATSPTEFPTFLNVILHQHSHHTYFEEFLLLLLTHLEKKETHPVLRWEITSEQWQSVLETVIKSLQLLPHPSITQLKLELIIKLCMHEMLNCSLNTIMDLEELKFIKMLAAGSQGITVASLAMTVWSLWLNDILNISPEKKCNELSSQIEEWSIFVREESQPHKSEISRHQAAVSLKIAGTNVLLNGILNNNQHENQDSTCHKLLLRVYEAGLTLLQDEDENIRKEVALFVYYLCTNSSCCFQSNVSIVVLSNWLENNIDDTEVYVDYLWSQCTPPVVTSCMCRNPKSTPTLFRQDEINIYAEPYCLLKYYEKKLLAGLKKLLAAKPGIWIQKIMKFASELKVISQHVKSLSDGVYEGGVQDLPWLKLAMHPKVFLSVVKLRCQVNTLVSQIPNLPTSCSLKELLEQLSEEFSNIQDKWKFLILLKSF